MKNSQQLLLNAALFSLLAGGLSSCQGEKQKPEQNNEPVPITVEAPANIISLEQADSIYANYTKHRVAAIENYETQERSPSEKFEAARFVDFDYQMIKDYIAYVDQEASKAGVKEVTKLRMYFGNYPNKKHFSNGKKVVHPRQNSIFLLPTLAENKGNYGFYIGSNGKAELIKDWKAKMLKGMGSTLSKRKMNEASLLTNFFSTSNAQGGGSLTLNFGNGGPPPHTDF